MSRRGLNGWRDDADARHAFVDDIRFNGRHADLTDAGGPGLIVLDPGSTGGTAIDAAGNICASDTDHARILRITPSGRVSTVIQDRRLGRVDAMRIDDHGGVDAVAVPTVISRLSIGPALVR